jgi:DNA invertase Pin-like site-specific DNA recombinase
MKNQHVHFKTMTDSIDTKTPVGRFFFHVMASLAMEQELIVERTRAVAGSADRTLRGLAERKGNYHLHPARVVSSVVPSLQDGINSAHCQLGRFCI